MPWLLLAFLACSPADGPAGPSRSASSARFGSLVTHAAVSGAGLGYVTTVADVDEDGRPDVVTSSPDPAGGWGAEGLAVFDGTVSLTGDDAYLSARTRVLGARGERGARNAVVATDFDHDGHTDLVVASENDVRGVRGPFGAPIADLTSAAFTWACPDELPWVRTVGDVDGDGFADWAFECGPEAGVVTGPLLAGATAAEAVSGLVPGVAVGDVDGDGRDDVLYGPEVLSGARRDVVVATVADGERLVPVGDLDGDGHADVVVGGDAPSSAWWLVRGPLSGPIDVAHADEIAWSTPERLESGQPAGDVDGDGSPEAFLVAREDYWDWRMYGLYRLRLVDGTPTVELLNSPTEEEPRTAVADLDGDGSPDLVVGSENLCGDGGYGVDGYVVLGR